MRAQTMISAVTQVLETVDTIRQATEENEQITETLGAAAETVSTRARNVTTMIGTQTDSIHDIRDAATQLKTMALHLNDLVRQFPLETESEKALAGTPLAAPLRLADSQELNVELSWGEGYRKIHGGNDLLPRALAKDVDVRLNQMVRLVAHTAGGATVETDRETFHGDRVLVTVPGPLVSELGFDPVLPAAKVRALLQLRYGNGTRLVAQYAEKEAVRSAIGMGCFTDRMPGYIMEQTMQQAGDHIVISGLAAGDAEPALLNEEETLDAFDSTISAVVGRPVKRTFGYVKNWTKDALTRSVVRAPLGDQRETVLPEIRRPIDGRVFFAGEYTDDRVGPGGMEGAIKSAHRVTQELLTQ